MTKRLGGIFHPVDPLIDAFVSLVNRPFLCSINSPAILDCGRCTPYRLRRIRHILKYFVQYQTLQPFPAATLGPFTWSRSSSPIMSRIDCRDRVGGFRVAQTAACILPFGCTSGPVCPSEHACLQNTGVSPLKNPSLPPTSLIDRSPSHHRTGTKIPHRLAWD